MTLRVTWLNAFKCEIAWVHAETTKDAVKQLIRMLRNAGEYLQEGDTFTVTNVPDKEDLQP